MDEREDRIRAKAHRIWLDQGSPEGRAEEHWEEAKLQVDQEDQQQASTPDAAPASGDEIRHAAADAGIAAAIGGAASAAVAGKAAPRKTVRRAKEAGPS